MPDRIVRHNPETVHPPVGDLYSHAVEVPPGARLLFIAGQLGIDVDGNVPESCEAQLEIAWSNVKEILKSADMTMDNIIKVTCYLKDPMYASAYARSCEKFLGSNKPAMTATIVRQLWSAEWHFEFDAVAAKVNQ
jgi:2-iminobutanoate/2-iminopropanoate deaminase